MKDKKMTSDERKKNMLDYIRCLTSVSVRELVSFFEVSEESIRRDLVRLEKTGKIKRVFGGAISLESQVRTSVSFELRNTAKKKEKERIAAKAVPFIEEGDHIFMDCSTTSCCLARRLLNFSNLTVITNSVAIADLLQLESSLDVIVLGGHFDRDLFCYKGSETIRALARYKADKAFVSCTGISMDSGLTDSDELQCEIRRIMMANSCHSYHIADRTKFGRVRLYSIGPLTEKDTVVCETKLPEEWQEYFSKNKIAAVYGDCEG